MKKDRGHEVSTFRSIDMTELSSKRGHEVDATFRFWIFRVQLRVQPLYSCNARYVWLYIYYAGRDEKITRPVHSGSHATRC